MKRGVGPGRRLQAAIARRRGTRDILLLEVILVLRKTTVAIDKELLTAVQRVLSTATLEDTIEQALREVLKAEARREEVKALAEMCGMDLLDQGVMGGAWRP